MYLRNSSTGVTTATYQVGAQLKISIKKIPLSPDDPVGAFRNLNVVERKVTSWGSKLKVPVVRQKLLELEWQGGRFFQANQKRRA